MAKRPTDVTSLYIGQAMFTIIYFECFVEVIYSTVRAFLSPTIDLSDQWLYSRHARPIFAAFGFAHFSAEFHAIRHITIVAGIPARFM